MFFFKKRKSLRVDWTQHGVVHGLLSGSVQLPAGVWPGDLELRVDGRAVALDATSASAGTTVTINIHTHLLQDGDHQLHVVARGTRGGGATGAPQSVTVRNPGALAGRVRESLRRTSVPVAFLGDTDASRYDYGDTSLTPWFDQPDADRHIRDLRETGRIDDADAEALAGFVRDGFLVLPGALPEPLIERALADIDQAVRDRYQGYQYGESTRLEQMHVQFPAIRELWLLPPVHRLLGLLYGEPSEPCQSLVYVFGSQQDAHQDTIHLTPFPAGYMSGVWIALEDVREGSGELMVYPGSHRLPRVYMKDVGCPKVRGDWTEFGASVVKRWGELVAASGIQPQPYLAKRGSILIWHENLMHAGSVRRDKSLSRRSVVTHNFARGSLVYYDSTGAAGFSFPTEERPAT